MFLKVF